MENIQKIITRKKLIKSRNPQGNNNIGKHSNYRIVFNYFFVLNQIDIY